MTKLVIICGPTASGKTALAVKVAKAVGGEVINCDSQQVYRYFDIGTAKPTEAERDGVPHHLFGVVDPGSHFNAADYVRLADQSITDVKGRGAVPVIAGGGGMYMRALTRGLCDIPEIPEKIEKALKNWIDTEGLGPAYQKLNEIDPLAAKRITPADRQRIERALQVYESFGVPISEFQRAHSFSERRYESLKIGIRIPRDIMIKRINKRTRELFESGFIDEVRGLLEMGYAPVLQSFLAHGYRHCAQVVKGTMTVERAIEITDRDTRRYAKRQMTWFRADSEVRWFDGPECAGAIEAAKDFLLLT